jgi:hypothetical protein
MRKAGHPFAVCGSGQGIAGERDAGAFREMMGYELAQ